MKTILVGVMITVVVLTTLWLWSAHAVRGGTEIYPGRCMMRVTYTQSRGLPGACRAAQGGFSFCRKRAEANVWEVATPLWCQE